jgi:hypothetical protein
VRKEQYARNIAQQRQFTKDLGFRGIEQAEVLPRLHLGSSLVGSRGGDAERLV